MAGEIVIDSISLLPKMASNVYDTQRLAVRLSNCGKSAGLLSMPNKFQIPDMGADTFDGKKGKEHV